MHPATALAILCFIIWAVFVFVTGTPSGWVHALLGAGFVLLARGLVGRRPG